MDQLNEASLTGDGSVDVIAGSTGALLEESGEVNMAENELGPND